MRTAAVSSEGIEGWAVRQLADYDARRPGTMFADGVVLNVSEGYELQAAVAGLRCQRGERVIGYKVGCTSPAIRAQLGIDHSITGRLYDSEKHASGATLSRKTFANLAIEGELAVELSREPELGDFAGDLLPACVARVIPVIELHHLVMRGEAPSAGELIANNAIHGGIVVGRGIYPKDVERAAGAASLALYSDDRLLEECVGEVLLQTVASSLQWLTEIVRERGERLSAGQIILTGSIPSLIPIEADCRLRVDSPPFGSVEASVVA